MFWQVIKRVLQTITLTLGWQMPKDPTLITGSDSADSGRFLVIQILYTPNDGATFHSHTHSSVRIGKPVVISFHGEFVDRVQEVDERM